jgi:hypothetical protein
LIVFIENDILEEPIHIIVDGCVLEDEVLDVECAFSVGEEIISTLILQILGALSE